MRWKCIIPFYPYVDFNTKNKHNLKFVTANKDYFQTLSKHKQYTILVAAYVLYTYKKIYIYKKSNRNGGVELFVTSLRLTRRINYVCNKTLLLSYRFPSNSIPFSFQSSIDTTQIYVVVCFFFILTRVSLEMRLSR